VRTPEHKAAIKIFREWCATNGVVVEPLCGADLVNRIAGALSSRQHTPETPRMRNRRRILAIAHPERAGA
jgi:hypothetical protein